MGNYSTPWKKYATFSGRATRAEYWTFTLVNVAIAIVIFAGGGAAKVDALVYVGIAFYVAIFIPSLAVLVRRLHDTGRSGGWFFIAFVPLIGGLWLFILTLLGGTPGPNQYGEQSA